MNSTKEIIDFQSPTSSILNQHEEETGQHKMERIQSDSILSKKGKSKERFPEISASVLDEAIKQDILPQQYRDKLIINPNKYSAFFAEFNVNSPLTRRALKNLNIDESEAKTLSYYEFSSQSFSTLKNIVSYLYYLTEHYNKLKRIINERNRLKKEQNSLTMLKNSSKFNYLNLGLNENTSEFNDEISGWGTTTTDPNSRSKVLNSPKMNKSTSYLLEKSKMGKTLEERKNGSIQKYGKYGQVVDFVKGQQIDDIVQQKKYLEVNIQEIEKKVAQRKAQLQKEIDLKAKELGQKIKNAQEKVRRYQEKQEMMVEKKLLDVDATGEKYEEFLRKKEEKRQLELARIREQKKQQMAEINKKREQKEQEDQLKRVHLIQQIEKKEINAENNVRKLKVVHNQKFHSLNQKYEEIISNQVNLKENDGVQNIQKICESELKRIQKTEERDKTIRKSIKVKQETYQKRLDKLSKFMESNEAKKENKLEKLKDKLQSKFSRVDKVNDSRLERSSQLMASNTFRQRKVHKNLANELYKYALLQDNVVRKHTDIDHRNRNNSNSYDQFFELNRSLSVDLFHKREDQFNSIK